MIIDSMEIKQILSTASGIMCWENGDKTILKYNNGRLTRNGSTYKTILDVKRIVFRPAHEAWEIIWKP